MQIKDTGAERTGTERIGTQPSAGWAWHLNAGNLWNLPTSSSAPRTDAGDIDYAAIRATGFTAIQRNAPDDAVLAAGLAMTGMGQLLDPADADALARQHAEWGFASSTWHVGTGFESDAEMDALAGAVLDASARHGLPIHVETHRATMTQDMRRTLDLVERFPDLRFTADLSHWYTGAEMTYGDIDAKIARLAPVFERVRYIHGRIGTPCCAQVPVTQGDTRPFVQHFRTMWAACLSGFQRTAPEGATLPFAPELLPYGGEFDGVMYTVYYARDIGNTGGSGEEESDRWTQALLLRDIACSVAEQP